MPVCNASTKKDSNYKLEIMAFTICPVVIMYQTKNKSKREQRKKVTVNQ